MSIQRFLSTRDAAGARKALAVSQVSDVVVSILLALTGIAILSFYQFYPPELAAGQTLSSIGDQLFPRFILNEMPAGLAGLIIAALLSAALSSLSSGLNSACAVIEKDFIPVDVESESSGATTVRRLQAMTWGVAAVVIGLSLLCLLIKGNIVELCFKVVNLLTAPLFVLFFLALFVRRSNALGAWVGLLCSTATAVSIAYAKDLNLPITVSFVWMMPCSLLAGVTSGTLVSIMTAPWYSKTQTPS